MMDLEKDEFDAWKAQPTTVKVLEYFRSRGEELGMLWASGHVMLPDQQGQAQAFIAMSLISYDEIEAHYRPEAVEGIDMGGEGDEE